MVGMYTMMSKKQAPPNWWWLDSRNPTKRSPWLQSTLSELDEKTTAMLKLIEEDAESFAQRAEMYYKKRPELISMVEDFYRTHRLLAERFDQVKSESATRLLTTLGSPFSCEKQSHPKKSFSLGVCKNYHDYSETSDDHEDGAESEVEDPDEEDRIEPTLPKDIFRGKIVAKEEEASPRVDSNNEIWKLKEEMERLKEENKMQRDLMARKDEGKREAILKDNPPGKMVAKEEDASPQMDCKMRKLEEEIERLKAENKMQRDQMAQKDEKKREVILKDISQGKMVAKEEEASPRVDVNDEMWKLKEEIERLKEENKIQRDQMAWKDEEKRQAIRQLSMSIDALKEENLSLKKQIVQTIRKWNKPLESNKNEGGSFLRRMFPRSSKKSLATVALL